MKDFFRGLVRSIFFWFLITPLVLLYFGMSYLSYQMILSSSDKLEQLEPAIIEAEEAGITLPYPQRSEYRRTYELYHNAQNLLQSFWFKYVFEFPEYKEPL
ncbi:hypothetical protein CR205_10350 [Alteribacter lacisalsi]|uniref:Sensor histidine kinase n=1 Tax=Alteribacter lacisalsi TaxID=2045244 RepID=A0A2W0HMZ8_9BACI|nr:hypothetical protein [Alteribacter lacisalsi]PYZ98945.1 hypothetical protein CR205_10350 [Alteribacter lacisalsi]